MAHEIAHRLHVRILNGNEEAMGPLWFFEGFALYAANQFEDSSLILSEEEIGEIIRSEERGSYEKYAFVFRYFLKKKPLEDMIEQAGKKDFIRWLEKQSNFCKISFQVLLRLAVQELYINICLPLNRAS